MENSNIQNYEKRNDIFLKLQKFHDYFSLKHGQEINNQKNPENTINEEKNIYIKYLDNPEIIFQKNDPNNKNLKLLFKQIENDIKNENNILFPFLNLTSNLVKAYIESDLDNNILQEKIIENINNSYVTKEDSYYLTIIDKIKYNSFIEKDIITYIYEYFSDLYDKVQTIKADNPLIKKFYKMMNLFQIFYEKGKNNNISSICSLGGSFKIFFDEKVSLSQNYTIYVNINILDYYFEDINLKNFSFIEINNYEKKYDSLLKNINNSRLKSISITINFNSIFIEFKTENNISNPIFENQIVFSEIKEINILEEFYGQISSIEVGIEKNNSKIEYIFQPISIRNENYMYFYEKKIMNKGNELNNIIPKIKVNNLVKVNYLNYNDKNFDIINYFGGVVQFLPFYHIFQAMEGENLNKMNDDIDKMKEVTTPEQNNSFTKTIINSNKKLELYKKYIYLGINRKDPFCYIEKSRYLYNQGDKKKAEYWRNRILKQVGTLADKGDAVACHLIAQTVFVSFLELYSVLEAKEDKDWSEENKKNVVYIKKYIETIHQRQWKQDTGRRHSQNAFHLK